MSSSPMNSATSAVPGPQATLFGLIVEEAEDQSSSISNSRAITIIACMTCIRHREPASRSVDCMHTSNRDRSAGSTSTTTLANRCLCTRLWLHLIPLWCRRRRAGLPARLSAREPVPDRRCPGFRTRRNPIQLIALRVTAGLAAAAASPSLRWAAARPSALVWDSL